MAVNKRAWKQDAAGTLYLYKEYIFETSPEEYDTFDILAVDKKKGTYALIGYFVYSNTGVFTSKDIGEWTKVNNHPISEFIAAVKIWHTSQMGISFTQYMKQTIDAELITDVYFKDYKVDIDLARAALKS